MSQKRQAKDEEHEPSKDEHEPYDNNIGPSPPTSYLQRQAKATYDPFYHPRPYHNIAPSPHPRPYPYHTTSYLPYPSYLPYQRQGSKDEAPSPPTYDPFYLYRPSPSPPTSYLPYQHLYPPHPYPYAHPPTSYHPYPNPYQYALDDDITKKALLPISEKITSSLFIDDVPDFLMCEICMDVLNEPLLTTCCGQSYCRECVNQLRQNTCPHCRDPLNTIEDKKSSRILSNTKIKCPYHLFNKCKWNGNTSDLKSHLTTCQFKPVTCAKKCGVSRERKNIDRHLKTECDLRSQYCQYCNKEVVHKEMSGHVAECPIFPLDCPNGCSQSKILRKDMKKHIEKCPLEIVSCEFAKFGCNVKPKRQELSNHNTSNMGDHVVLLARAIAIKDEKINQLENKVITLETKLKNKRII